MQKEFDKVINEKIELKEEKTKLFEEKTQINKEKLKLEEESKSFIEEIKVMQKQNESDKYQYQTKIYELKWQYEGNQKDDQKERDLEHQKEINKIRAKYEVKEWVEAMLNQLENDQKIEKLNKKFERKSEGINKILNILEKELFSSKFDLKKYEHEKVWELVIGQLVEGIDDGLPTEVIELLQVIKQNAPKVSSLIKSINETKLPRLTDYFSPDNDSIKYQNIVSRESISSNFSSILDDTMMTEVHDYIDKDKAEIYQTVDDMIKLIEAKEFLKKSQLFPSRKYSLKQLLFPVRPSFLSNIDESLISQIQSKTYRTLLMTSTIPASPSALPASPIQRLNNIKKQILTQKSVTLSTLYLTQIINTSLIYLLKHLVSTYNLSSNKLWNQLVSLLHSYTFSNSLSSSFNDHTEIIQNIKFEEEQKHQIIVSFLL